MMRFGEISIAMVLQIHPGFRWFSLFNAIATEREKRNFKTSLSQASAEQILLGKTLGLQCCYILYLNNFSAAFVWCCSNFTVSEMSL
jgi:ABC-type Na+ efflux pump permease subunit